MNSWRIFQGTREPHEGVKYLPNPPGWRRFERPSQQASGLTQKRGSVFESRPEEIDMVNAALYLRRPLLVTGNPGTGKTSLAYAVSYELQLGEVLQWPITTRSTLQEGLYQYDAIGRLQEAQSSWGRELSEIGRYIRLGPLGTALLPSEQPRVLLIDQIDKGDIDLPNELLHVLEEGEYEIPELARIAENVSEVSVLTAYRDETEKTFSDRTFRIQNGRVQCREFPLVIMTSSGERDFPPPFLRRCLRLDMKDPDDKQLKKIVDAYLQEDIEAQENKGQVSSLKEQVISLIHEFRESGEKGELLATDQLLNAIYLVTRKHFPNENESKELTKQLLKNLDTNEG